VLKKEYKMNVRVYFLNNYVGNANIQDEKASMFSNSSLLCNARSVLSVDDIQRLRIPKDVYVDIVISEAEFESL
jgi:hypothetical protein